MKVETKRRKKSMGGLKEMTGRDKSLNALFRIMEHGKRAFDEVMRDIGRTVIESIMLIEREELAGPDYYPTNPDLKKWAHEEGSVYVGDQKVDVMRPRLRSATDGEITLKSYDKLRSSGQFSEELLHKVLRGISAQKYEETVVGAAQACGVSPSSVSKKIVELTGKKLEEFKRRPLNGFMPFAIFLDTIHRGDEAFLVCAGQRIDHEG